MSNKQNEPHNEKGGGGQSSSTGTVADRSCRIKHGADIANRIRKVGGPLCVDCLISEGKGKNSKLTSNKALKSVFESKSLIFILNFQGY